MCALGTPGLMVQINWSGEGQLLRSKRREYASKTRISCQAGACAFDGQPRTSSSCLMYLVHSASLQLHPQATT
jgi:hypothetical protein